MFLRMGFLTLISNVSCPFTAFRLVWALFVNWLGSYSIFGMVVLSIVFGNFLSSFLNDDKSVFEIRYGNVSNTVFLRFCFYIKRDFSGKSKFITCAGVVNRGFFLVSLSVMKRLTVFNSKLLVEYSTRKMHH